MMVTTLNLESVKLGKKRGVVSGMTDPLDYMMCLEGAGFQNIHIKYLDQGIQAVYAYASSPPQSQLPGSKL